jgi:hypothetical protein
MASKAKGGFALDLKRPNRWRKDHVLMISSPSPAAALQAIDGYKHVGPLKNLNQSVKEVLIIVRSGF